MKEFFQHLTNCKDFDSAIIKGHLLTEHALDRYIESTSRAQVNIQDLRFSYSNKIEIAKILGLYLFDESVYKKLKLLNKLRNSIAHTLKFDEKVLTDFLEGFEVLASQLNLKTLKDMDISKSIDSANILKMESYQIVFCIQVAYLSVKIHPLPASAQV